MKKHCLAIIIVSWITIAILAIALFLATPHYMSFSRGSIQFKKVMVDGQPFLKVEGDAMNYLAQFQIVSVTRDDAKRQIVVTYFIVIKDPVINERVSNGWPIFCPLKGATPGKYSVIYMTDEGETPAGSIDVDEDFGAK